jgi:hypothetical protein
MDTHSGYNSGPWTDPSAQKLTVELWGKVGDDWKGHEAVPSKGKGKETVCNDIEDGEAEWRVLEEWKVNLEQLMPLPDDVGSPLNHLGVLLT